MSKARKHSNEMTAGDWRTAVVVEHQDHSTTLIDMRMRDVPVVGVAWGGEPGADALPALERVHFPTSDPDAYAVEIRGHSMAPLMNEREFAVAAPIRKPQAGDEVAITLRDGRRLVKVLAGLDASGYLLTGPEGHGAMRLARENVVRIHVVVGVVKRVLVRRQQRADGAGSPS